MRYHESCRYLKTKHWQPLWRRNIADLDALKDTAKSPCTFVAIDFEGLCTKDDEPLGITDIGIAAFPSPSATTTPIPDASGLRNQRLQTFFEENSIECYWMRLKGKRSILDARDKCHFAQLREIEPAQTETELVALLESIQQRFDSPLVLVGFGLVFELTTISAHLSQVFQFFSSWVDLQDIVMEISNPKKTHGLRSTLRAFGFVPGDMAVSGRKCAHNPASDTIREIAVLVNLLRLQKGATLQVEPRAKQEQNGVRRFWHGRAPSPKELYPFTARVYIRGKLLISILPHCNQLFNIFSAYDPIAVGISSRGKYGWVSLPSLDGLNCFIKDVHGKELKGDTWDVISKYDPLVIPMTLDQFSEAKQAAQKAEQGRKQLERRINREAASEKQKDTASTNIETLVKDEHLLL
ncbi:hypothetical protein O1611_g1325 [Lasiodiplodia mahajangana]|uniref:Uncharacterized protein n=1 Tax=Lasiodiplodia mahajangana TaxID=1108764 RepID=A0ACC2JY03_9PEZI|nr:hypothetical protein O1611_g1325 [Lasiodiplodia mahajangana]